MLAPKLTCCLYLKMVIKSRRQSRRKQNPVICYFLSLTAHVFALELALYALHMCLSSNSNVPRTLKEIKGFQLGLPSLLCTIAVQVLQGMNALESVAVAFLVLVSIFEVEQSVICK